MISPAVIRGLSDAYGSWKIICISLLKLRSSFDDILSCTLRPLNLISPPVISYKRMIERPVVDLPEPDSPTRPSVSPLYTSKLIPSTALMVPKCCFKSFTSKIFSAILFTALSKFNTSFIIFF